MYSRPRTSSQAWPGAQVRRRSASPQAGERRTSPGEWQKVRSSASGPVFPHPAQRPMAALISTLIPVEVLIVLAAIVGCVGGIYGIGGGPILAPVLIGAGGHSS
jgi:hypothetical protein